MKRLLDLNDDVLATILSFVRPADAIQLALTCHDAYSVAMPRYLSDVALGDTDPAVMSGPDQISLFCKYMLADVARRLRHLKALHIREGAFSRDAEGRDDWVSDYSCAPILAETLRQAFNLRTLAIHDLEPLLAAEPALADAFAPLTRLRDVAFHYIGKCTLQMLKLTTCHPQRLEFGMWKDGARVSGDTAAFYTYAGSLCTLNLWQCACLLESLSEDYVSHGVRTLGLGGRIPFLSMAARQFPNATRITFAEECSIGEEAPVAAWSALDYVEGNMPIPFFACRVRRIDLRFTLGAKLRPFSAETAFARTVEMLRQTSPVVLALKIDPALGPAKLAQLVAVLPRLRFLELALHTEERQDADRWMKEYVPCLAKTPLVGLALRGQGRPDAAPEIARLAAATIPTLAHAGVCPAQRWTWFRAERAARGEPVLEALSGTRGEYVGNELRALA
ncbi:hypothetical protein WOLCODRAFT_29663 [Wolfiporia cocos MD-104 SS10]|uniref:F-box domain-containing protein n=1 Tax=Wolfiporia cocos (strain MD-104) TaxID=742152 RepID=A0A2H3JID4_WOLCO|nr:hypothetical protein WOLCODRAFT_29663 [Wolfiporia cocos MD-104 SS10]